MAIIKSYKNQKGEKVVIAKMADNYLINAHKFFSKKKRKLDNDTTRYYYGGIQPQGEMAMDAFNAELNERESLSFDLGELILALDLEIAERRLKI